MVVASLLHGHHGLANDIIDLGLGQAEPHHACPGLKFEPEIGTGDGLLQVFQQLPDQGLFIFLPARADDPGKPGQAHVVHGCVRPRHVRDGLRNVTQELLDIIQAQRIAHFQQAAMVDRFHQYQAACLLRGHNAKAVQVALELRAILQARDLVYFSNAVMVLDLSLHYRSHGGQLPALLFREGSGSGIDDAQAADGMAGFHDQGNAGIEPDVRLAGYQRIA